MTERVSARLHDALESELLGLPADSPALSILVIARAASGQALQVSDVLLPSGKQDLEHTYPLS
ncbi:UTRA domain-containing protein [Streptomyces sp. ME18-1-4]|uniref:UTRA domain-containing protein n=1 Tax=Streptomyces sp. ME18-1-4 TaxID=3028685 RepID=UPI0029BF6972|nr:UTRA domain-containing protein [Streptomyces sp. ME18-1-4]MDX3242482.1 UTRA domain-containing protein [Streptomyces sp. ME18-1-4]